MKNLITLVFCVFCLFTSFSVSQTSMTVAGVLFDSTVKVGGSTLALNGAGVRTKSMFKIYAAGLYLTKSTTTTADVLALSGAKRLKIVMLRDTSSEDLGNNFMTAINSNTTKEERTKLVSSIAQFSALFETEATLKKSDVVSLDWLPGSGLQCALNNRKVGGFIGDAAFYQALLKVWIGGRPVDAGLRAALISGNPEVSR